MKNDKIVNIHGKDYMTVAGRLELAQKDIEDLNTEVVQTNDKHVVIKAYVKVKGVTYTGISSVSLEASKMIEKSNPYEVAETSAVGRALGFAGYGVIEGIASADEMNKSANYTPRPFVPRTAPSSGFTHTEDGNLPERQIDEDEPPFPGEEVTNELSCEHCGLQVNKKTGSKNGRTWTGYFCSSGDKSHTRWA